MKGIFFFVVQKTYFMVLSAKYMCEQINLLNWTLQLLGYNRISLLFGLRLSQVKINNTI